MNQMKNVWVDGSLRDSKWYEQVFEDIRKVTAAAVACAYGFLLRGSPYLRVQCARHVLRVAGLGLTFMRYVKNRCLQRSSC